MTSAVVGVGAVFAEGDGASPEAFTAVAEILSIGGPDQSVEEVDTTNLDSSGGFKETTPGLRDPGSYTLEMNWIKSAEQVSMRDKLASGASGNYRLTGPDSPATVADFAGIITAFSMTIEPNSVFTASMTVRISGPTTFS